MHHAPAVVAVMVSALIPVLPSGTSSEVDFGAWAVPFFTMRPARSAIADRELRTALTQAGLVPEALTAGGLTPEQVTVVVTNVRTALVNGLLPPSVPDASLRALQRDASHLSALAQRGVASDEQLQSLGVLRAQIVDAQTAREQAVAAVRVASGLNEQTLALLVRVQGNRRYGLPSDALVDPRGEAELVALRESTTQAAQAAARDAEMFGTRAAAPAGTDAPSPEMGSAKSYRELNGAANEAAWMQAARGQ